MTDANTLARLRELLEKAVEKALKKPCRVREDVDADVYRARRKEEVQQFLAHAKVEGSTLKRIAIFAAVNSAMSPPLGSLHHQLAIQSIALTAISEALSKLGASND